MKIRQILLASTLIVLTVSTAIYIPKKLSKTQISKDAQAAVPNLTFTPTKSSFSSAEILNPQRGYYRWRVDSTFFNSGEVVPVADGTSHTNTSYDSYERLTWNNLETGTAPTGQDASDPNYIETSRYQTGFDLIDSYAQNAKNRGGQFNFTIYTFCPDCSPNISTPSVLVPAYIANDTATYNGWTREFTIENDSAYVPDWNDEDFLVRTEKLLKALGERYNDDNRIGTIDIRIYGNWGEWHSHCIYPTFATWCRSWVDNTTYPPSPPNGQVGMTLANKQRLIDMHVNAFTKKRLLVLVDKDAIGYTANTSTLAGKVGWRGDCLGLHNGSSDGNGNTINAFEHFTRIDGRITPEDNDGDAVWASLWNAGFKDRWKEAPVWSEFCRYNPKRWTGAANVSGSKHTAQAAAEQIQEFHVSMVGNGNFHQSGTNAQKWATIPNSGPYNLQRDTLLSMTKYAGYRYELNELTIPSTIYKGENFSINTKWQNVGNAPIYENWEVWIRLKNTSTNEIWKVKSNVNLKNIDSSEVSESLVADTGNVALSVPNGTYEVSVSVEEPESVNPTYPNYRAPLALGITNRQGDGSYLLDAAQTVTITDVVSTSTPTPLPTNTPVPTATPIPTASSTPMPTNTPLPTSTPIPTATNTPVPTSSPTNTPLPTATNIPQPTSVPSSTPMPTATGTNTPTSTVSPTTNPTATATVAPTMGSFNFLQLTVPNNTKFTNANPTLTGKTFPNVKVKVTVYSNPQTGIVNSDANGIWSFTPPLPLEPGNHTYYASIISENGTEGPLVGPVTFNINTNNLPDTGSSSVFYSMFGGILVSAVLVLRFRRKELVS